MFLLRFVDRFICFYCALWIDLYFPIAFSINYVTPICPLDRSCV